MLLREEAKVEPATFDYKVNTGITGHITVPVLIFILLTLFLCYVFIIGIRVDSCTNVTRSEILRMGYNGPTTGMLVVSSPVTI